MVSVVWGNACGLGGCMFNVRGNTDYSGLTLQYMSNLVLVTICCLKNMCQIGRYQSVTQKEIQETAQLCM